MQLYNVTWQFPEIEGQKAAYAKLIEYMASGAEGDHIEGFELISRTHCPQTRQWRRDLQSGKQHGSVQALRSLARDVRRGIRYAACFHR